MEIGRCYAYAERYGVTANFTSWEGYHNGIWPLPNVHIGVTCESQEMADERIPLLLQTPAAKRFVSAEPLISSVDFSEWLFCDECNDASSYRPWGKGALDNPLSGAAGGRPWSYCFKCSDGDFPKIDQIICGAETGPGKRPMDLKWARSIRDQCRDSGVAFFMKKVSEGNVPDDLLIREYIQN
jgi:hypothetical protein